MGQEKIIDCGGPAFPSSEPCAHPEYFPGMTLRDYFAAKAMQGALANSDEGAYYCNEDGTRCTTHAQVYAAAALSAYQMADAMIAERSK